jgi:hypothetical protein
MVSSMKAIEMGWYGLKGISHDRLVNVEPRKLSDPFSPSLVKGEWD